MLVQGHSVEGMPRMYGDKTYIHTFRRLSPQYTVNVESEEGPERCKDTGRDSAELTAIQSVFSCSLQMHF